MDEYPELLLECDIDFYLSTQADLAGMNAEQAREHFDFYGSREGRAGSPAATREGFLNEIVYRQPGDILEIGPFCTPLLAGEQVSYLDVLDSAGLRARAMEHGLDPSGCPDNIHFTCDLDDIDARFDAVVSSHAIEHQPDLIRHFKAIGRILKPGGRYYLIIPDKRYCFDALMTESTVADVYQAYHEGRRNHSPASVIEHLAFTTHNDPARHWRGDHGTLDNAEFQARVEAAITNHSKAAGAYIDAHAWRFTPLSFRMVVNTFHRLKLIPLSIARVYATPHGRLEFCVVLENAASLPALAEEGFERVITDTEMRENVESGS